MVRAQDMAIPLSWAGPPAQLRPRQAEDHAFLRELFRLNRWQEVTAAGLDSLAGTLFLAQQFDLQCRHYDQHYRLNGQRFIVVLADRSVGRLELWANRTGDGHQDLRVVDIALLPNQCGQGLGTALLRTVQAWAVADGRSVSLHVDPDNPAARLYRRLGFRRQGYQGRRWRMIWHPPA